MGAEGANRSVHWQLACQRGDEVDTRVLWLDHNNRAKQLPIQLADTLEHTFIAAVHAWSYALLQVLEFAAVTEVLAARMQSEGPGLPSVHLASGIEQLRALQAEVAGLVKQQEELSLAEQLFGMDTSSFPHLAKVQTEDDAERCIPC